MITTTTRIAAAIAALTLPLLTATQAQAQAWPSKPITIQVGSAPGGSNDVFARAIGRRLQEVLGQPIVVDNKPAAGGIIANAFVAKSPPDGYNLVVVSSTFTTGAAIRPTCSTTR
jgi:tripartite-type tricarboxylate transporter receptor subunit TctC